MLNRIVKLPQYSFASNSSDQFVVLENMKKVNNTVQKLIVYGKEAAKKETDKGRQGQIIQNIQQLMTGFQNLQQVWTDC